MMKRQKFEIQIILVLRVLCSLVIQLLLPQRQLRTQSQFSRRRSCCYSDGSHGHHGCRCGHEYFPHISGCAKFSPMRTSPTARPSTVR
jgi:hypothetical protein